nr:hypothetical protein [Tanacetum cinerariifolium]
EIADSPVSTSIGQDTSSSIIPSTQDQEHSPIISQEGFVDQEYPSHVYKLKKPLYGLKQAPRAWYDMLSSFLISQHFSKGVVDPTLFTWIAGNDLLLAQIYADDITFASTNTALCNEFANQMTTKFKIPDLIHVVWLCARYQAKPTEKHLNALKRIFRYLKGTINTGLCWSSKKQKSTAISNTGAEYIAIFGCCAQILWMRSQLTDYGFTFKKIPLYCDNKSAIALCCNNVQHLRAKQIDGRYHFIKEQRKIQFLDRKAGYEKHVSGNNKMSDKRGRRVMVAFTISSDVPEIFMQQFWYTIKKVKDSDSYEFLLANKKCIVNAEVFRKILNIFPRVEGTPMFVDHMHQPWRTLAAIMNKENINYPELIWEDLAYQFDHRKENRSRLKNMPYPRFTKIITNHFLKQHKSLTNLNHKHYHTIKDDGIISRLKFVRIEPKPAKKKTASRRVVKKKVTLSADDNIISDDPDVALELAKSSKSVVIQDTSSAPKSKPSSLKTKLKGTGSKPGVLDEFTVISATLSEGTGAKLGVLDEDKDITEEKVILEWEDEQDSKHSDDDEKDGKDGDADDEAMIMSDGDEEIKDVEVEGSNKGDEEITDATKEEAEKTLEAKDDNKNTEVPSSSSSLFVSLELIEDDNAMDKGVADTVKDHKRKHDNDEDDDDDDDPPAGPNQGKKTKKRRTKESESSKNPSFTKDTPKGKAPTEGFKSGKSASTKEPVEEIVAEVIMDDVGDDLVHDDVQPQAASKPKTSKTLNPKWFKQPPRPPTHDPEWNKRQVVVDQPAQPWFNQMVSASKDPLSFNDLMATPINFSKYVLNGLKIENLTQDILLGHSFNLLKGTVPSSMRMTKMRQWESSTRVKDTNCGTDLSMKKLHGYGNLKEIVVKRSDQQLYKFKEGIVYEDLDKQKRFCEQMSYKFSDVTLKYVRDEIHHRILNFRLDYNPKIPKRKWTAVDRKRSSLMIELIDISCEKGKSSEI